MNRATIVLGAACAVLAAAAAALWVQARNAQTQVERLEIQLAKSADRSDGAVAHSPATPVQKPTVAQTPAAAWKMGPSRGASNIVVSEPPESGELGPEQLRSIRAQMEQQRKRLLEDPEYREAMVAQQRYSMRGMYGDLAATLSLTDAEESQLMDLLARHQLMLGAEGPVFFDPSDQTAASRDPAADRINELRQKQERELVALLGERRFAEFEDYSESMGARMELREFNSSLPTADALSADQMRPLVKALAQEQLRLSKEMQRTFREMANPDGSPGANWRAVVTEQTAQQNQGLRDIVAPYLTTRQLKRYEKMLQERSEAMRLQGVLMRQSGVDFVAGATSISLSRGVAVATPAIQTDPVK